MKNIALFLILLWGLPVAAGKITPEKKFRIVQADFLEKIKEKMHFMHPPGDHNISARSHSMKEKNGLLSISESMVSDDPAPESELYAAINPGDSSNIVASGIRQSDFSVSTPVYYTKDFGRTWLPSAFTGTPPNEADGGGNSGDPMFVYDLEGKNLFFMWLGDRFAPTFDTLSSYIWLARSTDGGATFSTSTSSKLDVESATVTVSGSSGAMNDKEWMTVDRSNSAGRGTIYGSYLVIDIGDTSETLHVARMLPGSMNFLPAHATIPTGNIVKVQIAAIDVDSKGNVHMSFYGSPDAEIYYMYHSVSTDGGRTFSAPNIISRAEIAYRSLTSFDYYIPGIDSARQVPSVEVACGRPGTPHADDIYCIWEALGIDYRGNSGNDIYFSRSTDNGSFWSTPMIVNNDFPRRERHQFRPSIFVNTKGVITAAWYDGRKADDNTSVDYYASYSFDGGKTFVGETNVSQQPTDFSTTGFLNSSFSVGEYLQVVASDHYAIPIWSDGRTNDGDLNIVSAFYPITGSPSAVERKENITSTTNVVPNPANEMLRVTFEVAKQSEVNISLMNMLGERVAAVAPALFEEGSHTITIPLVAISCGSYILRLETSEGPIDRIVKVVK